MNKQKISIVIPTFNRKEFLTQCIDSCLAQTYQCEIIVCDHGSTDGTDELMRQYEHRVTYIKRERDFGPHFCWLEGVLNASGDFIHLQFDDDWLEETFIEKTMALMSDDVGFSFSNTTTYDDSKQKFKKKKVQGLFEKTGVYDNNRLKRKILLKADVYSPGCCLFRKDILIDSIYQGSLPLKKTNNYHGVGPDMLVVLLSMFKYKKVGVVVENLAIFREHGKSITCDAHKDAAQKIAIRKAYLTTIEYYDFIRLCSPIFNILKYFNIFYLKRFFSMLLKINKINIIDKRSK